MRRDEDDIGAAHCEAVRQAGVGQRGHEGLALRRPGRDRWPSDREPLAREVDVVQLRPVDEPPGRDVADLGVVFPAVPQTPQDFDIVSRFLEQVPGQRLSPRRVGLLGWGRKRPAAEVGGLAGAGGDLNPYPGPARAHEIQGGDRLRNVERLGVGDGHAGHQPDPGGHGRDPGGDHDRVEAALHHVRPGIRRGERVLDGQEVDEAGLGQAGQIDPVPRREQLRRPGRRLPPRSRVPPRSIQGHGHMQATVVGHLRNPLASATQLSSPGGST